MDPEWRRDQNCDRADQFNIRKYKSCRESTAEGTAVCIPLQLFCLLPLFLNSSLMTVAGTPKAFPAEEYSVTASAAAYLNPAKADPEYHDAMCDCINAAYHNRQTLSFTGIACPSTQAFPAPHTGGTLCLDRSDRGP